MNRTGGGHEGPPLQRCKLGHGRGGPPWPAPGGNSNDMQVAVNTNEVVGNRYRIGMLVSLASIAMLFTSLSSAYIVRSGVTYDWYPIAVPRVMFGSTALILLSSLAIEIARRKLKQGLPASYSHYLALTGLLGLGFLVSQLFSWRHLEQQGVY